MHMMYGLQLNPVRDGWRGRELGMTTTSAWSSILCLRGGWLKRRAEFSRSATVSVAMHNIDGGLFHTMGRMSGIYTSSSPLSYEGKTNPRLGVFIGFNSMW